MLGVAGLIKPLQVSSEMLRCDLPWMVLTVVLLFPLVFSQRKITRLEGILMVGLYVIYMGWLVARATMPLHA
ncbi:MAG: hypothetical protein AAFY15_10075 [Cyanobacteria bacterium J06648_11]